MGDFPNPKEERVSELNGLLERIIMGLQRTETPQDPNNWGDWKLHQTSPQNDFGGGRGGNGRDARKDQSDLIAQLNAQLGSMGLQSVQKSPPDSDAAVIDVNSAWPFSISPKDAEKSKGDGTTQVIIEPEEPLDLGEASQAKNLQVKECWTPESVFSQKNPDVNHVNRHCNLGQPGETKSAFTRSLAMKAPLSTIGLLTWPQRQLAGRLASAKENMRNLWSSTPRPSNASDTASIISSATSLGDTRSQWDRDYKRMPKRGCQNPRFGPWTMFFFGMITGALLVSFSFLAISSEEEKSATPVTASQVAPKQSTYWEEMYLNSTIRISDLEKLVDLYKSKDLGQVGIRITGDDKPKGTTKHNDATTVIPVIVGTHSSTLGGKQDLGDITPGNFPEGNELDEGLASGSKHGEAKLGDNISGDKQKLGDIPLETKLGGNALGNNTLGGINMGDIKLGGNTLGDHPLGGTTKGNSTFKHDTSGGDTLGNNLVNNTLEDGTLGGNTPGENIMEDNTTEPKNQGDHMTSTPNLMNNTLDNGAMEGNNMGDNKLGGNTSGDHPLEGTTPGNSTFKNDISESDTLGNNLTNNTLGDGTLGGNKPTENILEHNTVEPNNQGENHITSTPKTLTTPVNSNPQPEISAATKPTLSTTTTTTSSPEVKTLKPSLSTLTPMTQTPSKSQTATLTTPSSPGKATYKTTSTPSASPGGSQVAPINLDQVESDQKTEKPDIGKDMSSVPEPTKGSKIPDSGEKSSGQNDLSSRSGKALEIDQIVPTTQRPSTLVGESLINSDWNPNQINSNEAVSDKPHAATSEPETNTSKKPTTNTTKKPSTMHLNENSSNEPLPTSPLSPKIDNSIDVVMQPTKQTHLEEKKPTTPNNAIHDDNGSLNNFKTEPNLKIDTTTTKMTMTSKPNPDGVTKYPTRQDVTPSPEVLQTTVSHKGSQENTNHKTDSDFPSIHGGGIDIKQPGSVIIPETEYDSKSGVGETTMSSIPDTTTKSQPRKPKKKKSWWQQLVEVVKAVAKKVNPFDNSKGKDPVLHIDIE